MKLGARIVRGVVKNVGTFAAATAIALTAASSLGDGEPRPTPAARRAAIANPAPILEAVGKAPEDLAIDADATARGIVVRAARKDHLVALLGARARAAAEASVELTIDLAALDDDAAREALARGVTIVWETSPNGELGVERGLIAISRRDGKLHADVARAAAPNVLERWSGPHHACEAHDDPFGGFAVLCRFDKTARDLAAASLTGAWPRDDVAVSRAGAAPVARFDLPLDGPNDAPVVASAVASFHLGRTGFVVDVDATRVPGEAKAVTLGFASRDQPIASDEEAVQAAAFRNKTRAAVSARKR